MATGRRHLAGDEELVHITRQHWTSVAGAFLVLILIVAAAAAVLWLLPQGQEWTRWAGYAVVGAAVIAAVVLWLVPLLRWWSTVYILSDRRLMYRHGLLTQHGRDIPLSRVNDVAFTMSLGERLLGCGTLTVSSAADQEGMELRRIPRVRRMQSEIYRTVEEAERGEVPPGPDDGEQPPGTTRGGP